MKRPQLEICAADLDSVEAAAHAGADRIELCSGLAEGGVTPSYGLIEASLKFPPLKVMVLIRPRGGDFVYSPGEVDVMVADIEACRRMGVPGVVFGALTPDGDIDMAACRRMADAAGDMEKTFHRAFDRCRDPFAALDDIAALGCTRILTSGQSPKADVGAALLRDIRAKANSLGIKILAGGGVTPANAGMLLTTGAADEVHASAKVKKPSAMRFVNTRMNEEMAHSTSSPEIIAQIINVISES